MRTTHLEEDFFYKEFSAKNSRQFPISNTNVVRNKASAMFLRLTKHASEKYKATLPLLELTTENTHTEQIWQQIELQILSILNLIKPIKPCLKLSSSTTQNCGRTESINWKQRMSNDSIITPILHDPNVLSAEVLPLNQNEQVVPLNRNILAAEKGLVEKKLRSKITSTKDESTDHKSVKTPLLLSSPFQFMQEKLSEEIDKLETSAITKESWSFVGEVSGRQRPLNSALESNLEFNQVSQPRPNTSIEATHTIENLIQQRILLNKWDDVKSTDGIKIGTMNMCTQLSDAKAKVGLGEMYAKSYMSQKSNEIEKVLNKVDSKNFELHCSTRNLFDQVIYKLTSLTDSSMTTEKRFEEILSEKRTLTSHTSKKTPEEIFKALGIRKHKKDASYLDMPTKKKSKSELKRMDKKIPLPKLAQIEGFHPGRAQTMKIPAERANEKQVYNCTTKKSNNSVFVKSSKVFNSLEMLKTNESQKQKALDSNTNVNRNKL